MPTSDRDLDAAPRCTAIRELPYQDDWTDEADEWHEEGDVRPLFGTVRQNCLLANGHDDDHEWPEITIPQPTRQLRAEYYGATRPAAEAPIPRLGDGPPHVWTSGVDVTIESDASPPAEQERR